MTEVADWSIRGVVFHGGSWDGRQADIFPALPSITLSQDIANHEVVETYGRTNEAQDGRTIFRLLAARPDMEDY
ncbi:MAG: hypothetical protein JWL79_3094 [Frankiales bacterium]|nr:hypothetical protein [Frankiales bacterium]